MKRSSGIVGVVAGIALLCLLVLTGAFARKQMLRRERQTMVLHARWRTRNLQDLLALSAIGGLSAEEQARLDAAGDDPERMRQVMLALHEQRLETASKDLEDAQQRKVELGSGGGYKVYADQLHPGDLVALANQDEIAATSAIAQEAEGIRRIRAWQPVSYGAFVAAGAGPAGVRAEAPLPPGRVRLKPDPRVPMGPEMAGEAATQPAPQQASEPAAQPGATTGDLPLPTGREVAESALHPTMTIYPEQGAAPAADADADLGRRRRTEAAIHETLQRWAEAMTLNDPRAEAAEYAPHLDRYFLRTDVSRPFVEQDKAAYLRRGNRTASFELKDVQIRNETDTKADVRLVKDVAWAESTSGLTHKLIRSELWLAQTGEGWKITGERDFR